MKVKDLRLVLAKAPDDALVVVPAFDHSYREATGDISKAVWESRNRLSEYHGPEYHDKEAKLIDVLVVG